MFQNYGYSSYIAIATALRWNPSVVISTSICVTMPEKSRNVASHAVIAFLSFMTITIALKFKLTNAGYSSMRTDILDIECIL